MPTITVIKQNPQGQETWRYQGQLLAQENGKILLQAYFDREDIWIQGMRLGKGDRFVETYYTNRWYNTFEIHAAEDDQLRGWYCNIGCPAVHEGDTLSYVDLALDLLVFPDGRQIVLDEDEFEQLAISSELRQQALQALNGLQQEFKRMLARI